MDWNMLVTISIASMAPNSNKSSAVCRGAFCLVTHRRFAESVISDVMKTISIGPIALPNPVLLAPMSGITDAPFRRMVAGQGAGLVISEMTACAALAEGKRNAKRRAQRQGAGLHAVQLAGCEARWMAEGARIAEHGGADIIDINMGCPAKNVTNGASGSALMRDLDHALTLIEAVDRGRQGPGDAENAARVG